MLVEYDWDGRQLESLQATIARYMEYPQKDSKRRFVIQTHKRGRSLHMDFRFQINSHLNGWSILYPGSVDKTIDWDAIKSGKRRMRAETKARQPTEWLCKRILEELNYDEVEAEKVFEMLCEQLLTMEGEVKPGGVGATRFEVGFFEIVEKGTYWEGTQKAYFHEYFLKGTKIFKDWTRLVVRGIKARRLDPETKKPTGTMELIWTVLIPIDQTPYCLGRRARSEGWKPPRGIIPVPPDWRTGRFKKEFEAWQEWIKGHSEEMVKETIPFTLHQVSYMGQKVVRGIPNLTWYLRMKLEGGVNSWQLEGNPTWESPLTAMYEGTINKKWFDYEGDLKPGEEYNPTKRLTAKMTILDSGKAVVDPEFTEKEGQQLKIIFLGKKMKGEWTLNQEEKGSEIFTLEHSERMSELVSGKPEGHFVYDMHWWDDRKHWDIRYRAGDFFEEFNLADDLLHEGSPVTAVRKKMWDPEWLKVKPKGTIMKVGDLETNVQTLDSGGITIIENTPIFVSMKLSGRRLKGYFTAKKDPESDGWVFGESKLPKAEKSRDKLGRIFGSPVFDDMLLDAFEDWRESGFTIDFLKTLQKRYEWLREQSHEFEMFALNAASEGIPLPHIPLNLNWHMDEAASMIVESHLKFYPTLSSRNPYKPSEKMIEAIFEEKTVRNEPEQFRIDIFDIRDFSRAEPDYKRYLPDLSLPSGVVDVIVALYPVPGTFHHAKVQAVVFEKDKWDKTRAVEWIRGKGLHTFDAVQVRGKE